MGAIVDTFKLTQDEHDGVAYKLKEALRKAQLHVKSSIDVSEPKSRVRAALWRLVNKPWFDEFIYCAIVVDTIIMCTEHRDQSKAIDLLNLSADWIFASLYVLEAAARMCAYTPRRYFSLARNWFDFFIVLCSILDLLQIPGFKALRVVRVLRLAQASNSVRAFLHNLNLSIPSFLNLFKLLGIIFLVFAGAGRAVFGDRTELFGSFSSAVITLYRLACGDEWNSIMKDLGPGGIPFSVVFVFLVTLAFINLFVASILANFEHEFVAHTLDAQSLDKYRAAWSHLTRVHARRFKRQLVQHWKIGQNKQLTTSTQKWPTEEEGKRAALHIARRVLRDDFLPGEYFGQLVTALNSPLGIADRITKSSSNSSSSDNGKTQERATKKAANGRIERFMNKTNEQIVNSTERFQTMLKQSVLSSSSSSFTSPKQWSGGLFSSSSSSSSKNEVIEDGDEGASAVTTPTVSPRRELPQPPMSPQGLSPLAEASAANNEHDSHTQDENGPRSRRGKKRLTKIGLSRAHSMRLAKLAHIPVTRTGFIEFQSTLHALIDLQHQLHHPHIKVARDFPEDQFFLHELLAAQTIRRFVKRTRAERIAMEWGVSNVN